MNKEEELLRKKSPVNVKNKKASFEYFFVETYTAGIVLTGTEIKSIRMGKASLVDTYCYIVNGEIWVKGMNISPYFYGSYNNHESNVQRHRLRTIIAFRNVEAEMNIALCRGKKQYDKRATLKEKEDKREMDRAFKRF